MKTKKNQTNSIKADENQKSLPNKILKEEKKVVKNNESKKALQEYDTTEKRLKTSENGLLNTEDLKNKRK